MQIDIVRFQINNFFYKLFIKEIIKPKLNIEIFLNNLYIDSKIFRMISDPNISDWGKHNFKIFISLEAITQIFGIEVANPMLISLIREFENKTISLKYFEFALKNIERYHFINNAIISGRSSGLDFKYSKYARELLNKTTKHEKHKIINQFIESLLQNLPDQKIFEAAFDNKLNYTSTKTTQKKLVQYVLQKLELKTNPNADLIGISIEHLYPEKSNNKLLSEDLIGNIGNLVLLDKDLNSDDRIGNKTYTIKRPMLLNKSHIITTKKVLEENNSWSEKEILNRRNKLVVELYLNIWK